MVGYRTEQKAPVVVDVSAAAADAQDRVIVELRLRNLASKLQALRPLDLDGGDGKKQRPRKIAFAADRRLRNGFLDGDIGQPFPPRSVEEKGSTGTKSIDPAIVVFKPSVGKRVMVRIPDSPAVSFFQLSALPAPSEVTTPMPVMTTIGLPDLSRVAVILFPRRSR